MRFFPAGHFPFTDSYDKINAVCSILCKEEKRMKYYVNASVAVSGDGSEERPFRTIQEAADVAVAGDEVLVAPGIYREDVNPKNAGTEEARIVYKSVEPRAAVITGAEPAKGWVKVAAGDPVAEDAKDFDGVYMLRVSNSLFADGNPFTTLVSGDWFIATMIAHTGDVFLNGKSMYEVTDKDGVFHPVKSKASWDRDFSVYTWYTEQDKAANETVILANFGAFDPNVENVEISARRHCFYPAEEGIGYITLSGFKVTEAATQCAPPTALQEGMIGPHWSKGWIIEDCEVSESKCSGISLGKYLQPNNDNKWLHWKYKDGTQTERDCICQAQYEGWTKERIGSHTIRNCDIHDCGQTGIVGHLGGVFSVIENNHIHHINNKQNLAGAEIGGIKMHAAIDVQIRNNHIHNCTRGLWLDWQAQGTRVTGNLFHDNTLPFDYLLESREGMQAIGEDIFIEVSHGPSLIDNNILLSDRSLKLATQGVAVVHNLIAGSLAAVGTGTDNGAKTLSSPRYTPYHVPHRTEVAGFMTFLHGDARFYNNIFIQKPKRARLAGMEAFYQEHPEMKGWDDGNVTVGTKPYDGYPTVEEWKAEFEGYCGMGSEPSDRYYMHLPVWTDGNVFLAGAKPYDKEQHFLTDDPEHPQEIRLSLTEADGRWTLETNAFEVAGKLAEAAAAQAEAEAAEGTEADPVCWLIDSDTLGMAFEPEERFENPDGSTIFFDTDYYGNSREEYFAGPFAEKKSVYEL